MRVILPKTIIGWCSYVFAQLWITNSVFAWPNGLWWLHFLFGVLMMVGWLIYELCEAPLE